MDLNAIEALQHNLQASSVSDRCIILEGDNQITAPKNTDAMSFGVLVLEIVSGKKNRGFYHPDHDFNLLGHAWKLWNENRAMELMDALMEKLIPASEVLRCIQVSLLCVQQHPEDRPLITSVLLMLDSENSSLPQPKQPGFYTERSITETDSSSSGKTPYTATELTITMLQAIEDQMAKQQSIGGQARATPAAKFISQASDDTTILPAFESSVGNIFSKRGLLAMLKCPSGLQSVKVKTA
ncbi:G-type lectin S-receptor-like serine/threonine-protein kinase SD1-1 [Quercus lobata]|uniref:G-type lectin S-receptor-like serine/threonine-protein kinase SD1-1 n=1 Tax=Quercus lobata TaxID=97700 RepID=UPI00124419E4|nr:G-type lectin S-receptor-like serine/threonine-protein kinase SD1-1 [Quercus lobata]